MSRHRVDASRARVAPFDRPRGGKGKGFRKAALAGTRWSAIQFGGSRITSVAVFLVLTHLLTPKAFGVVALANVFILLLQVVVEGGFGQAVIQREDLHDGHVDTVFWTSVTISLLLAGGLVVSAGSISDLLDEPDLAPVLRVLSLGLVIAALATSQNALLRRALRFKALATRSLICNLISAVAGVTVALLGGGVWALVVQYLVFTAAQTVTLWVLSGFRPGRDVSWQSFRDIASYSVSSLVNSLLQFTNNRSDDFLIGSRLGAKSLGVYAVGYRIISLLTDLINLVLLSVAFPVFSRLQKERKRLSGAYHQVLRAGVTMSFFAYLIFVVIAHDTTRVFFGPQWGEAADVMRILAVYGAIQTGYAVSENCINASGRPDLVWKNRLFNTAVQVALFYIAAPYGIRWVAVSLAVRAWVTLPILVAILRRQGISNYRSFFGSLLKPAFCAYAMLGVLELLYRFGLPDAAPWLRLLVAVPLGALIYFGLLALIDGEQLQAMVAVLRRRGGGPKPAKAAVPIKEKSTQ